MPDHNDYQRMVSSEEFIDLSYADQISARAQMAALILKDDERFLNLEPLQKQAAIQEIALKAPALRDKQFESFLNEVGTRIKAGDKNAIKWANTTVQTKALWTSSLIANLLFTKIALPVLEEKQDDWWPNAKEDGAKWLQLQHLNPDTHKATEYLDTLLSQDKQRSKRNKAIQKVAQIGGTIFDIAVIEGVTAGTIGHPVALGKVLLKPINKALARATGIAKHALTATKVGAHAGLTATLGVARENALRWANDMGNDPTGRELLHNNLAYFKNYLLGDILFNFATAVMWPVVKSMGVNIKGWGESKLFYKSVTKEQFDELVRRTLTLKDISTQADILRRLPNGIQRNILDLRAKLQVIDRVEDLTPDGILSLLGGKFGYNISKESDGVYRAYRMSSSAKRATRATSNIDDMFKWLAKKIETDDIGVLDDVHSGAIGAIDNRLKATEIIKTTLDEGAESSAAVLANLAAPVKGVFKTDRMSGFFKTLMKANGADAATLRKLKVVPRGNQLLFMSGTEELTRISKYARTGKAERIAIRKVIAVTDRITAGKATKGVAKEVLTKYEELLSAQQIYSPAWVEYAANKKWPDIKIQKMADNSFQFHHPTKGVLTFANHDELGNYIIRETVTFDSLKQHLWMNEGLKLSRAKDGSAVYLRSGRTKIAEARNIDELVSSAPELLPKIDSSLGPEMTYIARGGKIGVRYTAGTAHGPYLDVLEHLSQFSRKKIPEEVIIPGTKGKMVHNRATKSVRVELDEIGGYKEFNTVNAARSWMESGWRNLEELKIQANMKGYKLTTRNGQFILYSTDGKATVASSMDELTAELGKVKMPEWAPELTGLGDEILETMPKPKENFFKPSDFDFPEPDTIGPLLTASQYYRPFLGWLEAGVEKGIVPKGLVDRVRGVEDLLRVVRGQEGEAAKLIDTLFRVPGRKGNRMLPKARRIAIGEYVEAPMNKKAAVRSFYNLTDEELSVADSLRRFLGSSAESTGMFTRFEVRPERFVDDYLPRIRKYLDENPTKYWSDGARRQFYEDVFGHIPDDLDAFFKHERVSDICKFAREKDPYKLLMRYSSVGHRQQFLGEPWKALEDFMDANDIDPTVKLRVHKYRQDIMGIPEGAAMKNMRTFSEKVLQKFGVNASVSRDFSRAAMSWMYLASLGARPWIWIRNMFQIWTTLGPRIGNKWVVGAINNTKKLGNMADMLRAKGIIQQNLPLFGSEVFDPTSIMGRVTNKALKQFKSSDDFTRAVAYIASSDRFNDAMRKYRSGVIKSQKQLLDETGMWQLPRDLKLKAINLMNNGNWNAARDLFATNMVEDTMFAYRAGMSPMSFRSTVGKLFGMFGTYPVFYTENIRRALRYGTVGQKLAFAATFVGNTTLLYEGFKSLGIDAKNFIWYHPALFSGGPLYNLMNAALQAMSPSYKGTMARSELFGISTTKDGKIKWNPKNAELLRWMVPGGFILKSWAKGFESLNEGDTYGALLNFTTFPRGPEDADQDGTIENLSDVLF